LSPDGLRALGPTAVTLAELEGLDAHASAVTRRLAVLEAEVGLGGAHARASTVRT
jgi:histidinol dehydrogenase